MSQAPTTAPATTATRSPVLCSGRSVDSQKRQLFGNIASAMQGVPEEILRCQLGHFAEAGPDYATGVAKALGIKP